MGEDYVCLCKSVFMHLCTNHSFILSDGEFVSVLTSDLVDNISTVVHFEPFFRVQTESAPSFGKFVNDCDAF